MHLDLNDIEEMWNRHDLWSEYFPRVVAAKIANSTDIYVSSSEVDNAKVDALIEWCGKVADKMVEEKLKRIKKIQGK